MMTNEQLKMLRFIIQGEIEVASMAKSGSEFACGQEEINDQDWETLADSFERSMEVPNNWHQ